MPITLTVEDGTRPTGANTYASLADANAYWADRGNATWTDATDDEKSEALIKATAYINGLSWATGTPVGDDMAWPRSGAVAPSGGCFSMSMVPKAVVNATCYMAGEILAGNDPLAMQDRPALEINAGAVGVKFDPNAPIAPQFPAVRSILRGFLSASNTFKLLQA